MDLVIITLIAQYATVSHILIGGHDILRNNYIEELKNGKEIRIKYNKLMHDFVKDDSGWMEELWCYDGKNNLFQCYYPISTYEKDFYTTHTEKDVKFLIGESVRDFQNKNEDSDVLDIIIENSDIPGSTSTIREAAIEKLKTMTDEEIKRILL